MRLETGFLQTQVPPEGQHGINPAKDEETEKETQKPLARQPSKYDIQVARTSNVIFYIEINALFIELESYEIVKDAILQLFTSAVHLLNDLQKQNRREALDKWKNFQGRINDFKKQAETGFKKSDIEEIVSKIDEWRDAIGQLFNS